MAAELTKTVALSFAKGNVAAHSFSEASKTVTVSGTDYIHTTQNVGTAEEALGLGDLGSLGWAMFKNLDSTNFVSIKTATSGVAFTKLKAGESCVFRFGSGVTAPFVIADTAPVAIEYMIVED